MGLKCWGVVLGLGGLIWGLCEGGVGLGCDGFWGMILGGWGGKDWVRRLAGCFLGGYQWMSFIDLCSSKD